MRCCPRVDREKTLKALGVFSCQGYNQKHSVPLSRTKAPAHRLVRFLARDTRKNHSSISWSVSDDTRGNLPRAKKQSTGLFLCAAAHRPVRFLARDTRKNTPAQAGVFLMTHAGISRGLKNSPLDCFLCAAAHCPVRFLARDTRKNTPA